MNELRLPRVEKSLCGCSLETGAKIVGYLHVFGIVLTFMSVFIVEQKSEFMRPDDYNPRGGFEYFFFRDALMLAGVINMVAVSVAFLLGIRKKDPLFLEPFLITKGSFIIVDLFNFGMSIMARTLLMYKHIQLYFEIISIVLDSYVFTIAYSFYQKVREGGYSGNTREENI